MALKSKLTNNYPIADYERWVTGDTQNLDPIFLGRIAYLAMVNKKTLHITDGRRTHQEQAELYDKYLEYKRTGNGSIKLASKPYTSSHEFGIAIDSSSQPLRRMTNTQLIKYGLCKPISSEGWHIQPIETMYEKDFAKWEFVEADMTKQEVIEIMNELDPIYRTLNDIPDWGRETIRTLIADGKIKPDNGVINLRLSMLRIIVILSR